MCHTYLKNTENSLKMEVSKNENLEKSIKTLNLEHDLEITKIESKHQTEIENKNDKIKFLQNNLEEQKSHYDHSIELIRTEKEACIKAAMNEKLEKIDEIKKSFAEKANKLESAHRNKLSLAEQSLEKQQEEKQKYRVLFEIHVDQVG